jgi:hypothetical protein
LVEVDAGQYLVNWMHQLGPVRSNGMGLSIPDWSEIMAFMIANGVRPEPWEARTLRAMCKAYLSGLNTGKEPLSIPPIERGSEQ